MIAEFISKRDSYSTSFCYDIAVFTLERDSYNIILFVMTEDEYILYVSTGNQDLADTEADVSCNLIGEWGSTGSRLLAKSTNQMPFKLGQVSRMPYALYFS